MTSCLSSEIRALGTINQLWSFQVNVFPHRRNIAEYILCDLFAHHCYISSRIFIPCNCMQIINLHWMLHTLISWQVSLQLTVQMTFHSAFNPKFIRVKRKKKKKLKTHKLTSRLQWPQSPALLYWQKETVHTQKLVSWPTSVSSISIG